MKYITNGADNGVRQVVPQDFSFLSEGTRDVVAAMEKVIRAMYGFEADKPIWLGEMTFERAGVSGSIRYWQTSGGVVLWRGMLYDVEDLILSGTSIELAKLRTYIKLTDVEVAPSPVYGESGEKDVSVHRKAVAIPYILQEGETAGEEVFRLSDIAETGRVVRQETRFVRDVGTGI